MLLAALGIGRPVAPQLPRASPCCWPRSLLPQVQPVRPRAAGRACRRSWCSAAACCREAPEYGAAQPNAYTAGPAALRRLAGPRAAASRWPSPAASAGQRSAPASRPKATSRAACCAQDYGAGACAGCDAARATPRENAQRTARAAACPRASGASRWSPHRLAHAARGRASSSAPASRWCRRRPASRRRRRGPLLEWLPSADGLALSRLVLREALGRAVRPELSACRIHGRP